MAKKSKIAADRRRRRTVARYAERHAAMAALHALPRDASPTRLRNRDGVDGRPRGFLRKAGVSRVRFREMALRGELPGISKSSW